MKGHKKTGPVQHRLASHGCQEPRAPLNFSVAPSNFCREPKDVLVSIRNTFG